MCNVNIVTYNWYYQGTSSKDIVIWKSNRNLAVDKTRAGLMLMARYHKTIGLHLYCRIKKTNYLTFLQGPNSMDGRLTSLAPSGPSVLTDWIPLLVLAPCGTGSQLVLALTQDSTALFRPPEPSSVVRSAGDSEGRASGWLLRRLDF